MALHTSLITSASSVEENLEKLVNHRDSLNSIRVSLESTAKLLVEGYYLPEAVAQEPVTNFELITNQLTTAFEQGIGTVTRQFLPNLSRELENRIKSTIESLQGLNDEIDCATSRLSLVPVTTSLEVNHLSLADKLGTLNNTATNGSHNRNSLEPPLAPPYGTNQF